MAAYRMKRKTLAQIKRNPPPGAKGYKARQDKPKPGPTTDTGRR